MKPRYWLEGFIAATMGGIPDWAQQLNAYALREQGVLFPARCLEAIADGTFRIVLINTIAGNPCYPLLAHQVQADYDRLLVSVGAITLLGVLFIVAEVTGVFEKIFG